MPDPMTPERLAEIRDLSMNSTSGYATYNPDIWTLDAARRELVAEVERLRAELAVQTEQREIARARGEGLKAELAETTHALKVTGEKLEAVRGQRDSAESELDAIRTRDEPVGSALYDIVRTHRFREEMDEHEFVHLIEERVVHPLVAKLRQARAQASRTGRRRRPAS